MSPADVSAEESWHPEALSVGGLKGRIWRAGDGEPLLVLHGAGGVDPAPYRDLSAHARVIYLELPGFGESDPLPGDVSFPLIAERVLTVADALGLERFSVLGVSFGGVTAAWLATLAPTRIARLVLVAPAALAPGGPAQLAPEQLAGALRAHPERGEPEHLPAQEADRQFAYVAGVFATVDDAALRVALDGLDIPTMIVFGTLDGLIAPETGREYKRLIPRSDLVYVYDSAHEVPRDRPEAFRSLVADFLARGEAHVVSRTSRLINP